MRARHLLVVDRRHILLIDVRHHGGHIVPVARNAPVLQLTLESLACRARALGALRLARLVQV